MVRYSCILPSGLRANAWLMPVINLCTFPTSRSMVASRRWTGTSAGRFAATLGIRRSPPEQGSSATLRGVPVDGATARLAASFSIRFFPLEQGNSPVRAMIAVVAEYVLDGASA
jgi:hypothetical protein